MILVDTNREDAKLWTRDGSLGTLATRFGVAFPEPNA